MTSGAMPPTGPDQPISTADERAGEGRHDREEVDELPGERIDRRRTITGAGSRRGHGHPATSATRTMRPAWAAKINPICRSQATRLPVTASGVRRRSSIGSRPRPIPRARSDADP